MVNEMIERESPAVTLTETNLKRLGENQEEKEKARSLKNLLSSSRGGGTGEAGGVRVNFTDDEESIADDASSNSSSSSSSSSSGGHTGSESDKDGQKIAQKETQNVAASKIVVYFVLIVLAGAVGTATNFFLTAAETTVAKEQFHIDVDEIETVSHHNFLVFVRSLHGLSQTCTNLVEVDPDQTWPFVTLPGFGTMVETQVLMPFDTTDDALLSQKSAVLYAPVVSSAKMTEWEQYSQQNGNQQQQQQRKGRKLALKTWTDMFPSASSSSAEQVPALDYHVPVWQVEPANNMSNIQNLDLSTNPIFRQGIEEILAKGHRGSLFFTSAMLGPEFGHLLFDINEPLTYILQPIYQTLSTSSSSSLGKNIEASRVVGFLMAAFEWNPYFDYILPNGRGGLIMVIQDSCAAKNSEEAAITYELPVETPTAQFVGLGDLHDRDFGGISKEFNFTESAFLLPGCNIAVKGYVSSGFEAVYMTYTPALYTSIVMLVVIMTLLVFVVYDVAVTKKQKKVVEMAERTTKIVSSLFPKNVRDQLLEEAAAKAKEKTTDKTTTSAQVEDDDAKTYWSAKNKLQSFARSSISLPGDTLSVVSGGVYKTKPIADFFPEATIMFADLVGFTAWSSMREPAQVFTLLETIYHAFDEIARRRRVFKVETVGDCYVAVVGLPHPRKDHAVVMARFAKDCLFKMQPLTKQLEIILGPDTAELGMRFGLHSGPVTAGVLRGEKSRFQLFGDTMNTTARIETTGKKNQIHLSADTYRQLADHGKGHWCSKRHETVTAKGKGEMETYWLLASTSSGSKTNGSSRGGSESGDTEMGQGLDDAFDHMKAVPENAAVDPVHKKVLDEKAARLIDWVTDIMKSVLYEILVRRSLTGVTPDNEAMMHEAEVDYQCRHSQVLDEVVEIIALPKFDPRIMGKKLEAEPIIEDAVIKQLHDFIQAIAGMYNNNPFHNFEHASHVTMSVVKLLARINVPDLKDDDANHATLHDHTYGITSDPLTQFAVIFAALIHDVDHPGVPNMQLVKEETSMAVAYKNRSIAEQNSVDIAWDLLMDSSFTALRRKIYATKDEFLRFRQLVVNAVMATDIMDKDLGALRKERWAKAFAEDSIDFESCTERSTNRKATIVIEHLIQASDVAHTMQHWYIYQKWNKRFFEECYAAYIQGRSDKNPADSWYKGEIGFFDFYIIPLAKKLKDCGVFGVSSDEYLNYAMNNRKEWELKGESIVEQLVESAKDSTATGATTSEV